MSETDNKSKLLEMHNRTGLSLLKCREYLIQTNGDLDKAMKLAREDTFEDIKQRGGVMDG